MTPATHEKKNTWMPAPIVRATPSDLPRSILTLGRVKRLLASTALAVCMMHAQPVLADVTIEKTVTQTAPGATSVETTVTTEQKTAPVAGTTTTKTEWSTEEHSTSATGARVINFIEFDLNKNSILSVDEVGQMLFKLFDTDGNEVIDNIEFERRAVVTIMPMEKNSVVSYDFDGDGIADTTKYTYETFTRDTMLTRFDKNRDGLSPHEFMNTDFMAGDINNDKFVDLKEWQGSYIASIDKENKAKAGFNK